MKVTVELTVEQLAIIDRALLHLRAAEQFNANAIHATLEEKRQAERDLFVIDSIRNHNLAEQDA